MWRREHEEKCDTKVPPPKKHTTVQFKKMMGWVGENMGFENVEKAILGKMWQKCPPPPKKNTQTSLENGGLGKMWQRENQGKWENVRAQHRTENEKYNTW